MAKSIDQRINDTVTYIRGTRFVGSEATATEVEANYHNNHTRQREMSEALAIGEKNPFQKAERKTIRAVVLIGMVRGHVLLTGALGGLGTKRELETLQGLPTAIVTERLRALCAAGLKPGNNVFDAQTWLMSRNGMVNRNGFFERQLALQQYFLGQVGQVANLLTKQVYTEALNRVGKLDWAAGESNAEAANKFKCWLPTNASSTENIRMNCFEGVLYCAFQAGAITRDQLTAHYANYRFDDQSWNHKALFGTDTLFATAAQTPGYLLTWTTPAAVARMSHGAIYLGIYTDPVSHVADHYLWQVLSLSQATTGYPPGGGFAHIDTVKSVNDLYGGTASCYICQPFWEPGAITNTYFRTL